MIRSNLLLPVMVLVIAGLLIAISYTISDDKKSVDNPQLLDISKNNNTLKNESNNSYAGKNSTPKLNINVIQNTKPVFNVGDKFVYEFTHIPSPYLIVNNAILFNKSVECILEYNITDKIRLDEIPYFKIQENAHKCIIGALKVKGVFKPIYTGGYTQTIYVNGDTGEMFIGLETGEEQKITGCYWSGCWYAQWMLKLDDNLAWQEEQVYSEDERVIYEYSVEGREKIDGRECFEVKKKWRECLNGSCKITARELDYIDVEKRVSLRYSLWYEDLPFRETKLIDQNYFNKTTKPLWDVKINISEYNERMRVINRIGYCEDNFCNPENNETIESCCMDCGCPEGKICKGVCMQDKGESLEFSSEEYGFGITLPSGWRGKWRGDSIFFELASEPWTSVEVFFGSLTGKTPQYAYYTSDNLTAGNKNFTLIYSAPAQDDYENNLGLYEEIRSSFRGI